MSRGCIWAAIVLTVLALLVIGVIIPRSILGRKNGTTPTPTPALPAQTR